MSLKIIARIAVLPFFLILFCFGRMAMAQTSLSFTDSRAVQTLPNTYNMKFEPHFKYAAVVGLPAEWPNMYYNLLGFRGWSDDTGVKGHELAFSNDGKFYWRSGYDQIGWENWRQVMVTDQVGNLALKDGNLGIGTTSADNEQGWQRVLDVYGPGHSKLLVRSSEVKTGIFSHNYWGSPVGRIGTESNHDLQLMAGYGNTVMSLTTGGNVGIGIKNPSDKFAVNGNIRAKEVRVETTNWPDYVFDDDYKNLGLSELELYIKVNKHLPDLPSASKIERDGFELGEMNKILLKKIEELTLHLITLQKENIMLRSDIKVNNGLLGRVGAAEKALIELRKIVSVKKINSK